MEIFAFVAQLSFLSPIIIAWFIVHMYYGLRCTRYIADADTRRMLSTGILVMPIIFIADILWFVPTIWLPLLIACSLARIESHQVKPCNVQSLPSISIVTHMS